jgi:hypothetical protein
LPEYQKLARWKCPSLGHSNLSLEIVLSLEGELRESSERVELAIWNDERKERSVDYKQTKGGVREK